MAIFKTTKLTSFLSASFLLISALSASNAQAALNCSSIERIGNGMSSTIIREINASVAGLENRINRRKTLRIHNVNRVWFTGCRMHIDLRVSLKRKVRRDAHGNVVVGANITSFTLRPKKKVCYNNARVESVSLSRTLNIGERVYRWAANKALPGAGCFSE